MQKHAPIVISVLALLISMGSLAINFLSFRERSLLPEIFTKLNQFSVESDPVVINADIDFSISNRSSKTVFIAACNIATDGLGSLGGYWERLAPCDFEDRVLDAEYPLEIVSGQTQFFSVHHSQKIEDDDLSLVLKIMGIDLSQIEDKLSNIGCIVSFFVSNNAYGFNQNCDLVSEDETGKAFDLIIQTGTGEIIRTAINLKMIQAWPWGRY